MQMTYPTGGTAKRAALGSFWTFLGHVIKGVEQIIFVPLFLWAWGKALYGEWLTLFSMISYLSVSRLGMGDYVANRMTQAYSRGDMKEYAKTFKSALGIYSVISILLLVGLAIFSFSAPFTEWFNIEIASELSVRFSVLILGSYIFLSSFSGIFLDLYITMGEFSRNMILMNIREILLVAFIALALVFKSGFVGVALVYLVLFLLFTAFVAWDALRRHREVDLSRSSIDWKLAGSFVVPGLIFLLIPLSNMIYLQGSILVISSVLGSVAVAVFGVHRTLANLIQRFTSTLNPAIRPELTAGEARGEYEKIQLIHRMFTKVVLFVSISLSISLLFFGEEIMQLWTGGEIVFDSNLWILFLVLIPILAFWNFSSNFQIATNKYKKLALSRIISTALGLVLAIVLIKPLGLVGVVLGFLVSELLVDFWYIPYNTLGIIRENKKKFIVSFLGVFPMTVLQLVLGWFVAGLFANIWLKIISVGLVVVVVGGFYTYLLWFDKKEKNTADSFVGKFKAKFLKR